MPVFYFMVLIKPCSCFVTAMSGRLRAGTEFKGVPVKRRIVGVLNNTTCPSSRSQ